jgi:pilus assembly protein TadC
MDSIPSFIWLSGAAVMLGLGIFGLRGWLEIRDALRLAEFERLSAPPCWSAARALLGTLLAIPMLFAGSALGRGALLAALVVAAIGFAVAPEFLRAARRRVEQQILDQLSLHLDLLALAMESGNGWQAALVLCAERAPDGSLRRAWDRVILEIHAGAEPLEALRNLEQRLKLRPFATLVSALRAAEKMQMPAAAVLRDRARQSAAARFARAERRARAAPLKLWAAMLLCLVPCIALVLAFPVAQLLAQLLD